MITRQSTPERPANIVAAWETEFSAVDGSCPWPGPRPLVQGDAERLLVGREDDIEKFTNLVGSHRLVLLSGDSGVGKSSLLELGLLPGLTTKGYTFSVARDWGAATGDVWEILAGAVWDGFAPAVRQKYDLPRDFQLFYRLQSELGRTAVIVLDQFEELLRYGSALRKEVIDALLQMHQTFTIRMVLSYRSEFHHELRALEANAEPFQCTSLDLKEVDPSAGVDVLQKPDLDALGRRFEVVPDSVEDVITPAAAMRLAELWQEQVRRGLRDSESGYKIRVRTGLLHLQAAAYSLHFAANPVWVDRPVAPEPITLELLEEVTVQAGDAGVPLFEYLMQQAVNTKLDLCRSAARRAGLDRFQRRSVPSYIARIAPQLSSASYKLVREVGELTRSVLDEELEAVVRGTEGLQRYVAIEQPVTSALNLLLSDALRDHADGRVPLLASPRSVLALALEGERWRLWLADRQESQDGAGPMMGQPTGPILLEELRRMAWALLWMNTCRLLRVTRHQADMTVVSLIHDGFGEALTAWAEGFQRDDAISPFASITRPAGKDFDWSQIDETGSAWSPEPMLAGTEDRPRHFVNAVLKGDSVFGARFTHVVFVNCDFRGVLFLKCTFRGVTFLNCQLDGALFNQCTVAGEAERPVYAPVEGEPTYVVDGGDIPGVAAEIDAYLERGTDFEPNCLVSHQGQPARPAQRESVGEALPWAPAAGGLVFYGGRLSSLTLLGTVFVEGARHHLVNLTGSGLDIPGIAHGSYGIVDCKLRHVAFTPDPSAGDPTLSLEVTGSVAVQWWFSEGLHGNAEFGDSMLIQPWVAGEEGDRVEVRPVEGLDPGVRFDSSPAVDDVEGIPELLGKAIGHRLEREGGLIQGMDYQ